VNTYHYDAANRLVSLSGPQGGTTYCYNGLRDRLDETVNGQLTTFVVDLNACLTQTISDGSIEIYGFLLSK
jgi:YD repeat-containing protein